MRKFFKLIPRANASSKIIVGDKRVSIFHLQDWKNWKREKVSSNIIYDCYKGVKSWFHNQTGEKNDRSGNGKTFDIIDLVNCHRSKYLTCYCYIQQLSTSHWDKNLSKITCIPYTLPGISHKSI